MASWVLFDPVPAMMGTLPACLVVDDFDDLGLLFMIQLGRFSRRPARDEAITLHFVEEIVDQFASPASSMEKSSLKGGWSRGHTVR